jgi:hypothetical protein
MPSVPLLKHSLLTKHSVTSHCLTVGTRASYILPYVPFLQHSVQMKLSVERKKVQSVFIPTLGSDIRLGTYSSLPECYFLDTRTEGALGTNFSVPNVLFPAYSVQWDTRYKWIGFLWASASKFFCDAWFQEYTSGSKFCKF